MKQIVSGLFEVAGLGVIAAGLWLIVPWLGVIAAGVALVACGMAVDPPRRAGK